MSEPTENTTAHAATTTQPSRLVVSANEWKLLLSAAAMLAVGLVSLLEKKVVRWRGEF